MRWIRLFFTPVTTALILRFGLRPTRSKVKSVRCKSYTNKALPATRMNTFLLMTTTTNFTLPKGSMETFFTNASLWAIGIACLGLFGLVTFTVESRTKEIGVRKILGASVASIVSLLSKDFVVLVFIAFVIASPIALYGMNQWLNDYSYRINISWQIFLAAGLIAVVIALVTISFQAIKAAIANPVKSLRTE